MPLDSTTHPEPPKRSHQRKPVPVESTPAVPAKRSHARKPASDANAEARAELDRTLAALLPRAKTAASRAWVTYAVATRAVSLNEAWRETSKKALVASGSLPDYAANPLPVGTVLTVYSDPLVTAGVKVVPQAPRLNVDACFADLLAAGVKPALLKRLRKKHTTDFSGAHILTALLANT